MEQGSVFRLVVGLGNPGAKYEGTRHNVGFAVLDELARRSAGSFSYESRWEADCVLCAGRMLMKPRTYMNLSGESVGNYSRYYRIPAAEVLVIYDDIALPLGDLRIRKAGSAGGHNGLESVLVHLGTESIPRLRVGIGGNSGRALTDHVLGRFQSEEIPVIEEAVVRAADAVEYANAHGVEAAMNQFNQKKTQ